MIEMLTEKEYHTTFEKRHNFLQMCVWVYYDAEKDQIVDFATKIFLMEIKNKLR